jgi:hypothetical protein
MVDSREVVVRHMKFSQSYESSVAATFRSINESNGISTDLALSRPVHVPVSVLGQRG